MPAKKTTTKKPAAATPATAAPATPPAAGAQAPDSALRTPHSALAPEAPIERDDALLDELSRELGVEPETPANPDPDNDDLPADDDPDSLPGDAADDDAPPAADTPPADDAAHDPAGGDPDPDPDAGAGDDDPPETPAPADDKIAALEAKIEELNARLAAASPDPAAAAPRARLSAEDEVAAAETPQELARLQDKFQRIEDWARDNPDGAEIPSRDPNADPVSYTPEQIRQIGRNASRALRALPGQAQYLRQRAHYDELAAKAYPDFANPKSDMAKYYATMMQNPAYRRLPYLKLIIGDAEIGRRAREAKEKAAAGDGRPGTRVAPAARRPVPVLPTGGARKPVPATGKEARAALAKKRAAAVTTGSATELEGVIETYLD